MDQRIPDLSDKELEALHANAVRLLDSGTVQQRQQAESLLPLLGEALEARRAERVKAQALQKEESLARRAAARASAKNALK